MIRCIVVDDKPLAIDILEAYIAKVPYLSLVFQTQNPLDALDYLRKQPVDLVFLDIQMPELNGLQFISLAAGRPRVILTTAYPDFALEGYAHDVVDYLLKPIPFERFLQAVEKVRSLAVPKESGSLFVKTEHRIQRVPLEDILYIEARQNYVCIFMGSGRIMSLQNIKAIEERLPPLRFIRVHKSYIVSLEKIDTVEKSRIFIGEAVIPIGDSYREEVFRALST
jgi:two-component system LytT family response regulator